jgi:hypothetical protein
MASNADFDKGFKHLERQMEERIAATAEHTQ